MERRLILDLLRFAQGIPYFPVERNVELGPLAQARQVSPIRISWLTLFTRAYALAAQELPELRSFYRSFPWPRIYQSTSVVTTVAVNRQTPHGDQLFFGRLHHPDSKELATIQQDLDRLTQGDIAEVYRREKLYSRLPTLLRSLGWWWRMQMQPQKRARRLGTCSISVLAREGVLNRRHPSILTSSLSYGPIKDGQAWVTLQCDHRVLDGMVAAKALNRIAHHLESTLVTELMDLQSKAA